MATDNNDIAEILKNIDTLQTTEQNLIDQLDVAAKSPSFDPNGPLIVSLVANINNVSASRQTLFATVGKHAKLLQDSVANSRVDLVGQLTLLKTVESQLNDAKAAMDKLKNRNDTQMRLVEINTYYGKRYEFQSSLMKKLILICVPVLILFILKKKTLIPEMISNYLIGIVIAVGAFFIMQDVWDLFTRSNINFDEYNWDYDDPSKRAPSIWQYNVDNLFKFSNPFKNLMKNLGICVGDMCCDTGMTFDKKQQKCKPPEKLTNTDYLSRNPKKQGFTTQSAMSKQGGQLNGTIIADYPVSQAGGIEPFSQDFNYQSV